MQGLYRLYAGRRPLGGGKFDDGIARCGWPIEEHRSVHGPRLEELAQGDYYDIPYRCLLPVNRDGLLVAGRGMSADHDAHSSARVMATCMAMGQAAGVAAALAAARSVSPKAIPAGEVRQRVHDLGGLV